MATISIIIPSYNRAHTIVKTVNSVLNQTFIDFEIILVDDGSNDNTEEILSEMLETDSRIKYFYQENAGVSAARNHGISLSDGEYICFLDSDDYYEDNFLEKMYDKVINHRLEVCYCGFREFNKTIIRKKKTKFLNRDFLSEYIAGIVAITTSSFMIKKELITNNRITFLENVSWGEDFEFFCKVLAFANKVGSVADYLTNYRRDADIDQLSVFSLNKINEDYEFIMRLKGNHFITKDKEIESVLINYRLPGRIIYPLVKEINNNKETDTVLNYLKQYEEHIFKPIFLKMSILRTIKLNIYKHKLKKFYKKHKYE